MKTFVLFLLSSLCLWAGEFQNLNFEAGNPANVQLQAGRLLGPAAELLPGWRVQYDGMEANEVFYSPQGGPGFCCGVALNEMPEHLQPFFGKYVLDVDPAMPGFGGEPVGFPITLSQTGRVPDLAEFLQFPALLNPPEFRINGNSMVLDHQTWSLDVSSYAGQEVDLAFTFLPLQSSSFFEVRGFSIVPEPKTWALLGVGLGAVLWWSRRK